MSDFKDKCGDVLTGGATGAAAKGSIGAAIGILGGPVTSGTSGIHESTGQASVYGGNIHMKLILYQLFCFSYTGTHCFYHTAAHSPVLQYLYCFDRSTAWRTYHIL